MAYNPSSAVSAIYRLKGEWDAANKAGDAAKKKKASEDAKKYYDELIRNDYGSVADELSAADYQKAKSIYDKWSNFNVTNSDNGGVGSAGNVGTPTREDPISQADLSTKNSVEVNSKVNDLWGIETEDHAKNNELWLKEYDYLKNTNPFSTAEGKAIMGKFDLAGLQGRDNAVASGGSDNGGNIDSFSAANAMRQQAALVNQGQTAVLSAHQQKLDNARAILEGLGVQQQNSYKSMQDTIGIQQTEAQRNFESSETAKNNETARLSEQAAVTGYVPPQWAIQNDAFLKNFVDENGKLKPEYYGTDFQELINNAKAKGDTELAKKYAILRGLKIFGNFSDYGKYLKEGDVSYIESPRTAEYDLNNKQIESAERISAGTNASNEKIATTNAEADLYKDLLKQNEPSKEQKQEQVKRDADKTISDWLYSPDSLAGDGSGYKGYDGTQKVQYIAAEKISDDEIVSFLIDKLIASGYSDKEAKNKIEEYKINIAKQVAAIEGKDATSDAVLMDIFKRYGLDWTKE